MSAPPGGYPRSLAHFAALADAGAALDLPGAHLVGLLTQGWCGLYALALLERHPRWSLAAVPTACAHPGWDCVPLGGGRCAYGVAHVLCGPPGGPAADAGGWRAGAGLVPLADAEAAALVEEWYFPYPTSLDGAATARRLAGGARPAGLLVGA